MKTSFRSSAEQANSEEKRRIFKELVSYRKKHGIGCFKDISAATGGKVAVYTILHMYTGTKVSNDIWLEVGKAMEQLRR